MIFHALVARQSANARLALALARLAVTTLGRHGANQVALAITAARFDVAVSILETQEKDEYQQRSSVFLRSSTWWRPQIKSKTFGDNHNQS